MTDIVIVPAAPVVPPFPALGDPAFNQKAYDWGVALPGVSGEVQDIAVTAHTNATVAKEQALASASSASAAAGSATLATTNGAAQVTLAAGQVTLATAQADLAMGYRNTAGAHATTATDKAAQAVGDAAAALGYRNTAQTAAGDAATEADRARDEADRAEGYAAGISDGPVTSVNGLTGIVVLPPGIINIDYDNRAQLRVNSTGTHALVDGLGLFQYAAGSDEPDDDESCFATASGRWLLQAAHWDLIDAWQLPEVEERDAYDEDEPLRFAASFAASFAAKVITGSATCAITSVTSVSSASFTGTITGAAVGDSVIATPPAALGATAAETGRLGYHAFVSAANTVTIMLTNASAAAANTNAAIRAAWPITVIKS